MATLSPDGVQPRNAAASGAAEPAAAGAGAAAQQVQPAAPQRLVAVVFGPPLSGVTTQAQLLGRRYGVPVINLDALVQVSKGRQSEAEKGCAPDKATPSCCSSIMPCAPQDA